MRHDTAVQIGAGGMGEVFKAWDPDLERHVALKYLRSNDPELVERLLREARAQARIDHPSICRVYEVGVDQGKPFIAMQFVDGKLLDEAAETMSIEQKVLVIKQVAEAVQAAHAEGLIHRDIKPRNIMVGEGEDGELRPYVLDFGIAREQEVEGLTVSGQVLGTPGYLSPEQARGDGASLDRRTDIFSLGVVLYELCSGGPPFAGDSNVEVLVSLLETEAMPLRQRAPGLPRDLETVAMRCLEKDPDRRYPSARALAEDLRRFLDGEPVAARPVSLAERLVRRARKNPLTTVAVVAAVIAIVALVFVAVGGWIKYTADLKHERNTALEARAVAEAERKVAEAREQEAREIADFLVSVFATSDPDESHGEEITARELLDRGSNRIEDELGGRPETQARLLGIMGEVYGRLGLHDRAQPLLERALQQVLGLPDHSAESEIEARVRLADLFIRLSDPENAAELAAPIAQIVSEADEVDPSVAVQGLGCIGRAQMDQGRFVDATSTMTQALALAEREFGAEAPLVGDLLNDMAFISYSQKLFDQSITESSRALEIRESNYGSDDPRVATTLNALGQAFLGAGRLEEAAEVGERALEIRERTLGRDHPRTGSALNNLGLIYTKMGNLDRAEEFYLRSLELRKKAFGKDNNRVALAYSNLAGVYRARGDLDRAEATYRKALAIQEANLGPDHPDVAFALTGIAIIAKMRGEHADVERLAKRVLEIREAAHGENSRNLVGALRVIGESQLALGKLEAARLCLERARGIAAASYGEDHEQVVMLDSKLAEVEAARTGAAGGQGHSDTP